MPFEDVPSRLEDILKAMQEMQSFVSGKSFDDYRSDTMLRFAIERCVEIISEASRHIPADLKAAHPEVPWQNVADIGNILRHAYRAIDAHIMWKVATRDVGPLRRAVEQMLVQLGPKPNA